MKAKTDLTAPELSDVKKTRLMRQIEESHNGQDIRIIISELYQKHGIKTKVAEELGIDQSLLFFWSMRLGISYEHVVAIDGQRVTQEA